MSFDDEKGWKDGMVLGAVAAMKSSVSLDLPSSRTS
jgi:hypothetical protein